MKIRTFCLPALAGIFLVNSVTHAATVKATYQFDNTLAANESGVAALSAVNPLSTNAYLTDSVFGNNRTVYAFNGNTASAQQAGLSFTNGSELISPNSYSLHLVFQFSSASTFKRIVDVQIATVTTACMPIAVACVFTQRPPALKHPSHPTSTAT